MNQSAGNALIMILIFTLLIASISLDVFDFSLENYKISQKIANHQQALQQSEMCLLMLANTDRIALQPLNNNITNQNPDWWQQHGIGCGQDTKYYAQLRFSAANHNYVLLDIYHKKHILLQAMLLQEHDVLQIISWAEITA